MTAWISAFIFIKAFMYPKASEKHGMIGHSDHVETTDLPDQNQTAPQKTLKEKFELLGKVISLWRVKRVMIYIFVATLTCTNQDVFLIYSNEVQFNIDALFMGSMATISFFGTTYWLMLYNSTFANTKCKRLIMISYILRFFGNNIMALSVRT
jgi:hypothetical protein